MFGKLDKEFILTEAERSKRYREKRKLDLAKQAHSNEMARLRMRRARQRSPDKYKHITKKSHSKKPWFKNAFKGRHLCRMPKWANRQKILQIYKEAYEKGLEVDHIIPYNGTSISGLHVENNLQLLTREENREKGNKLIGLP